MKCKTFTNIYLTPIYSCESFLKKVELKRGWHNGKEYCRGVTTGHLVIHILTLSHLSKVIYDLSNFNLFYMKCFLKVIGGEFLYNQPCISCDNGPFYQGHWLRTRLRRMSKLFFRLNSSAQTPTRSGRYNPVHGNRSSINFTFTCFKGHQRTFRGIGGFRFRWPLKGKAGTLCWYVRKG